MSLFMIRMTMIRRNKNDKKKEKKPYKPWLIGCSLCKVISDFVNDLSDGSRFYILKRLNGSKYMGE